MSISSRTRGMGRLPLLCAALCLGCVSTGRGYQLYVGPAADPSTVANLNGYVQSVDGQDVRKHARSLELLPGCHVITTPKSWGGVGETGGVVATTGPITYAIRMLAGHSYSIEVRQDGSAGSTSSVRISAKEKDATGKVTDTFSPAFNDPTCQEEHRGGKDLILQVPTLGH